MFVQTHIEATVRTHVQNAAFVEKIQAYELADLKEYNAQLLDTIYEMEMAASAKAFDQTHGVHIRAQPHHRNSLPMPTVE